MTKNKMTKQSKVAYHLKDLGSITSWEAIEQYGATRLSAIIYNLKKKGWVFDDETIEWTDRYGDTTHFKRYITKKVGDI